MLRCYLISFRLTFPTEKTAGDNFGLKNNFEVANFIKIEFKWHLSKQNRINLLTVCVKHTRYI